MIKTKNKKNVLKKNPPAPLPDVLLVDLSDPVPLPSSTASLPAEPLIEKRTTEKLIKTKNKKTLLKKNPSAPLPDVLLVDLTNPLPLPSSTASLHVEPLIDFDVYLHAPDISDPFGDPFPTLDPEKVPLPTPDSQSATRGTNSSSTEPLLN